MTTPALRVATYHRVSTFDQDPSLARGELAAAARGRGRARGRGDGERRNDRPGLQRLMDAARRGKLDVVLVWKLDRFGRSALDVLANIRELDGAGVRFIATTQGLDVRPGGDAMSRLILGVLASVAEFERDIIRERTSARAREGQGVGQAARAAVRPHRRAGREGAEPARRRAVVGEGRGDGRVQGRRGEARGGPSGVARGGARDVERVKDLRAAAHAGRWFFFNHWSWETTRPQSSHRSANATSIAKGPEPRSSFFSRCPLADPHRSHLKGSPLTTSMGSPPVPVF